MTFKSFYGPTIREALKAAQQELGPDAAILASRQVTAAEGLPGAYEVVCGIVPALAPLKPAALASVPAPVSASPVTAQTTQSVSGLTRLRKRVNTFRSSLGRGETVEPEVDPLRCALLADGFDEELTAEIVSGVRRRVGESRSGLTEEAALSAELGARVSIEASLGRAQARRKITALVGPPGAGKTSLIVKLAVRYGLALRKPMRLISLDGARIGGADALRTYGAGMAVPVDVLETGSALTQILESRQEAGLILIDTPGLSSGDAGSFADLAGALSRNPEIDVQLVIPATASAADLKATNARFRSFLPTRLALTQVDNAACCRAALALALSRDLPISYAGTGPRIPEDLEEASVASLLRINASPAAGTPRSAVSAA